MSGTGYSEPPKSNLLFRLFLTSWAHTFAFCRAEQGPNRPKVSGVDGTACIR